MKLNKVMHVEDDECIRIVTEMALSDIAGFEVLSCEGAESALKEVVAFAPDLILLDVMMPKMDGLETLAELKKIPSLTTTPIVFMTAKIQPSEKQIYIDAGAVGVIEKPFDPMTIGSTLNQLFIEAQEFNL
jgi:CheY-like chemotaxis protein